MLIKRKKSDTSGRMLMMGYFKSVFSEQFRSIRANINFSIKDKGAKTLLITSASVGEGKSTIASNLGVAFAQEGKKVLLIDADLRKPTMHFTFNQFISPGITNLLLSNWSIEDVVKDSGIKGLHIITCGPIPPNPAELISHRSMDQFIAEAKKKYDLIIFDAPPLLSVADAQVLSEKCDGTIVVVSLGKTEKRNMVKAIEALQHSKANIVGAVLNNYKLDKNHHYYEAYVETE